MAENRTGKTLDVDSITNSAVMAVDDVFRKNDLAAAHRHNELRVILETMVASVVADHIAETARDRLDLVVAATEQEVVG